MSKIKNQLRLLSTTKDAHCEQDLGQDTYYFPAATCLSAPRGSRWHWGSLADDINLDPWGRVSARLSISDFPGCPYMS